MLIQEILYLAIKDWQTLKMYMATDLMEVKMNIPKEENRCN